jgi:hypothetical protein
MAKAKSSLVTSPRIEEIKRKKKKRIRIAVLFYSVSFIVIFVGLAFASRIPKIRINNIEVNGTHIIDSADVIQNINNHISGRYIYMFDRNNAFIYPKSSIEKDLKDKFPRIESLSVSLRGFHTIVVDIGERTGAYLYCGANIPEVSNEAGDNCYFINTSGEVFDKAPYFSGNVYFKFYIPIEGMEDPLNKIIMSKETFQKVISFVDGLESLGLHAVSVVMSDPTQYAFYLDRKGNTSSPVIYFNKENNLDTIFANLASAMNKQEFKDEIMSKYDTLLYIDLRFNNKVLYKFH